MNISEDQAKAIVRGIMHRLGFSSMHCDKLQFIYFVASGYIQIGANYDGVRCPIIVSEDQCGYDYYCFKVPNLCSTSQYLAILDAMLAYAKNGKWVLCIDIVHDHERRCVIAPNTTYEELQMTADLNCNGEC